MLRTFQVCGLCACLWCHVGAAEGGSHHPALNSAPPPTESEVQGVRERYESIVHDARMEALAELRELLRSYSKVTAKVNAAQEILRMEPADEEARRLLAELRARRDDFPHVIEHDGSVSKGISQCLQFSKSALLLRNSYQSIPEAFLHAVYAGVHQDVVGGGRAPFAAPNGLPDAQIDILFSGHQEVAIRRMVIRNPIQASTARRFALIGVCANGKRLNPDGYESTLVKITEPTLLSLFVDQDVEQWVGQPLLLELYTESGEVHALNIIVPSSSSADAAVTVVD